MLIQARAVVLLFLVTACSSGGGGGRRVAKVTGSSCDGTPQGAQACPGEVCLSLTENVQNKVGICSQICDDTDPCDDNELCVGPGPDGNNYCFHSCTANNSCTDGFVCTPLDAADSICFVETTAGGGDGDGDGNTPADCESDGCAIYTETDMIDGYCANTPGTLKLCDCPSAAFPPSCTPTDPAALNLYCCP